MAEEKQNEEIAVTEQEATATPAKEQAKETSKKTENKSEKTQKSECAKSLTPSNIVVWCCLFALAFATLQYFFVAVAYVDVVRIIFAVFKILCMIGAGVTLSVNLVKEKSLKLDVSLVMFLSTMLICLNNIGIF